ncbi:MAG: hypothetical protein JWQ19_3718 [Subtercola sp.]|nr:hypothetical protein [Subtercola sp.]
MNKLRREVGFWGSVGRLKLSQLLSVEYVSSLLFGVGAAILLTMFGSLDSRISVAGDFLTIAPALVGVVFAGMALVVALMSDAYMRLLAESESGITGFLSPFMIALGIQVSTVVGAVGYRAFAPFMSSETEPWVFGALCVIFIASCLELVVLARNVFMHARLRTRLQEATVSEFQRVRQSKASNQ